VIEAEDGMSAIRELTHPAAPVDAVILDYRLPDSDDWSLLSNIRRLSPHSPVILMTVFSSSELTAGARRLGVSAVLSKPFEMHDLEPLLLRACFPGPF
jgi:DNA-binding NtrC family response regulator